MYTLVNPLPRPKKNIINDNLFDHIPRKNNKIEEVNTQLYEITNILNDNIETNITTMENLVSTDKLKDNRLRLNKKKKIKMYLKNKKLQAFISGIVVVIIIIILV